MQTLESTWPRLSRFFLLRLVGLLIAICSPAGICAEATDITTCTDVLLAKRHLDVRELGPDERVIYDFQIPGLRILAELSSDALRFGPKLHRFRLDYDPQMIGRLSPYRSILGGQPMQYTESDLRHFGQAFIVDYGLSMEFYLRLPNDPKKLIESGPLLHVTLDGGHVFGYAAGTDVDAGVLAILRGSVGAIGRFIAGVTTEIRLLIRNRHPEAGGHFRSGVESN